MFSCNFYPPPYVMPSGNKALLLSSQQTQSLPQNIVMSLMDDPKIGCIEETDVYTAM
jgi:hypothetical protein